MKIKKPALSFWQIWNMNVGFFGIQFSFGLQQTAVNPIFSFLGAHHEELPLLNLAGPVTGLLIQPIIGAISDKTWSVGVGVFSPTPNMLEITKDFKITKGTSIYLSAGYPFFLVGITSQSSYNNNGLLLSSGSEVKTSIAAPAILPSFNTLAKSNSFIMPPRATFTILAFDFIFINCL